MEKKIDRRIAYKIVVDTETCPINKDVLGVDPYNMFVYDIGWTVFDRKGRIYEKRSFIVSEVFFGENELMQSAYYANKIPRYMESVENGTRFIKPWAEICGIFRKDCIDYNITDIFAHNQRFDKISLRNTDRWLTKSKYRYFFPYGVNIYDTLAMSRKVLGNMPTYKKFCEENGYVTKHKTPRPQMKAETIYRFLTKDTTFVEEHMGLDDALIETTIAVYLLKRTAPM